MRAHIMTALVIMSLLVVACAREETPRTPPGDNTVPPDTGDVTIPVTPTNATGNITNATAELPEDLVGDNPDPGLLTDLGDTTQDLV